MKHVFHFWKDVISFNRLRCEILYWNRVRKVTTNLPNLWFLGGCLGHFGHSTTFERGFSCILIIHCSFSSLELENRRNSPETSLKKSRIFQIGCDICYLSDRLSYMVRFISEWISRPNCFRVAFAGNYFLEYCTSVDFSGNYR